MKENIRPLSLGEFVTLLREAGKDPNWKNVIFMFGGKPNMKVHSYRGYYDHAALGWSGGDYGTSSGVDANELADAIEAQYGSYMSGWKGGEFLIHKNIPLWCANDGCFGPAIVGIEDNQILVAKTDWF